MGRHEAVVELLLQQPGLDVNLTGGANRETALHFACYAGHARIVKKLLAHPSLTCHNVTGSNGMTPLAIAVFKKQVECVRALVAVKGVDLAGGMDPDEMSLEEMAIGMDPRCEEVCQVVREELRRRGYKPVTVYKSSRISEGGNKNKGSEEKKLEREMAKQEINDDKINEIVELLNSPAKGEKESKYN